MVIETKKEITVVLWHKSFINFQRDEDFEERMHSHKVFKIREAHRENLGDLNIFLETNRLMECVKKNMSGIIDGVLVVKFSLSIEWIEELTYERVVTSFTIIVTMSVIDIRMNLKRKLDIE